MLRDPNDVDPSDPNSRYKGLCMDLLLRLQADLKFSFTLYIVEDGNYGAIDEETGDWNGLVGDLIKEVCSSLMYKSFVKIVELKLPNLSALYWVLFRLKEKNVPTFGN